MYLLFLKITNSPFSYSAKITPRTEQKNSTTLQEKRRKRTKTAKAKELALEEETPSATCASTLHEQDNASQVINIPEKKQKINGEKKKKDSKEPDLKNSQLESSKLMAREVIEVMERNSPPEKDDHEIRVAYKKTSPANSASPVSSSADNISSANCLTPLSSSTRLTPRSCLQSSKWSSTSTCSNSSQEDALQTREEDQFSSTSNFSTSTPTSSTNTDKLYSQTARRELIREETPLSSQLSSAIRLSYDCDDEWNTECTQWLDSIKQKEANDKISPECSECVELRDENQKLKESIARLKKEKERLAGNVQVILCFGSFSE